MKTVSLSDLNTTDFAITDISVIYQTPSWTKLDGKKRILNGFIFVDKGSCRYEWEGDCADLSHGSLIYLAKGSDRVVTVTEEPFSLYRICFKITDLADGEEIIFDPTPTVINTDSQDLLFDLCAQMKKSSLTKSRIFKTTSLMCEFLHIISKSLKKDEGGKISPATDYLDRHFADDTHIETLANLCFMSKSHFFRTFKSETGQTPLEYRNKIRIERAKILLGDGECSVGEIAHMLGFESIYYFSRIFKKITGIAPTKYKKHI